LGFRSERREILEIEGLELIGMGKEVKEKKGQGRVIGEG